MNKGPNKPVVFLDYDYEDGIAAWAVRKWDFDVSDINQEIAAKYEFPDADRHHEFLHEAIAIIQGFSRIKIENGIVIVPSDLTEFKRANAQFQKVIRTICELPEMIFALQCDPTMEMLLHHIDEGGEISKFQGSLPRVINTLTKIDALTGTAGNRPTGDWSRDFCVHCQRFWAEEKGGGTRIIFEQTRRTHITNWVEDVYEALRKRIGINTPISKIKTVARNVPAYRPPSKPINGDTS